MNEVIEVAEASEVLEGIIVGQHDGTQLVTIQNRPVVEIFTHPGLVPALLEAIRNVAKDGFNPDVSTAKGRDAIKAQAFKVTKTKTYLEEMGKAESARIKALVKPLDEGRKALWDGLEAIQAETRKPLTDWEAEQERIEADKKAAEAAAAVARQIENDHEMGILLNEVHDRKAEEARRIKEQEARERDEQIAREAREKAEADARTAIESATRQKEEAERRLEQEKRDAAEREAKALQDAERERQAATEREERARQEAVEAERRRVESERLEAQRKEAAELAEQVRQAQGVEHRRKFNTEALSDLISQVPGLTEDAAKAVLTAIVTAKVRHVAITY